MPRSHLAVENSGQIRPMPGSGGGSGLEYMQASAGVGFTPLAPFGASPDGLGRAAAVYQPSQTNSGALSLGGSPILRSLQKLTQNRARRSLRGYGGYGGYGDDAVTPADAAVIAPITAAAPVVATGILLAVVALDLALCGAAGYYVGKAVAPSAAKEQKYAWWGVAAGLIGGPLGLGIEACVALNQKGAR